MTGEVHYSHYGPSGAAGVLCNAAAISLARALMLRKCAQVPRRCAAARMRR